MELECVRHPGWEGGRRSHDGGYSKCLKVLNIFLFILLNKMLVIKAGIHKMLDRVANREDPDQTASSEAVWSGSALFVLAFLTGN